MRMAENPPPTPPLLKGESRKKAPRWIPTQPGKLLLLLLLLIPLPACTSLQPPRSELDLDIPPVWSAAEPVDGPVELASDTKGADSEARWWKDLADPVLSSLIEEALEKNYNLQAAAQAVTAAAAQARIAGADLKPQANFRLDGSRRQQVFVGLPIPGSSGVLTSRSTSFGASLDISWEADLWGRLRAGKNAAANSAWAAQADYEAARLSLAGQVAKAWFALGEAERQVRLAEDTAESRGTTSDRAQARYRQGLAAPLDIRLALSNQAQAESSLAARRRQLDSSRRQLELLLGRYPSAQLLADDRLADDRLMTLSQSPVPIGIPADLVRRRPDLQAAEERLLAAGWQVSSARAAFFPRLNLTGSGGSATDAFSDLLDGDFLVWTLASSLLQPIFQGGRLKAAVELAQAGHERALAEYAQLLLQAFTEVEIALAAEMTLAEEEKALATAAEQSAAAAKLAEDRYWAGLENYLQVLESQRQAFAFESQLLAVRGRRLNNRVDLHLALGGDFVDREKEETAVISTAQEVSASP